MTTKQSYVTFVLCVAGACANAGCGDAAGTGAAPRDVATPTPNSVVGAPPPPPAPGTPPRAETEPPASAPQALPAVWTAPLGTALTCDNVKLAFDFDPTRAGYGVTNAFWMMWAAERAFGSDKRETRDELAGIGFDSYADFNVPSTGLQAFVAGSATSVIVAFRGSTELRDWMANFDFPQHEGAAYGVGGRVHRGFATALEGSFAAIEDAVARFSRSGQAVWVTGHSLGGAMATLAAARLAHDGHAVASLHTFGAPRAGDTRFASDVWAALGGRYYRFVNEKDLVPRVAPSGKAAAQAAEIAQIEFAERGVESLLRDLDYAHGGALFQFDTGSKLTAYPPMSDAEDVTYWGELASRSSNGRLLNLIGDNAEQASRHKQTTYLCKMKDAHLAALASRPASEAPR